MKHSQTVRKSILVLVSVFLSLMLAVSSVSAESASKKGAKTAPPPIEDSSSRYIPETSEISARGSFNPSHIYLDHGNNQIGIAAGGEVLMDASTFATMYVDEVGIKMTLEKWTGSAWIDVATTITLADYSDNYIAISDSSFEPTGYYYRIRSFHYAQHGSTYESGNFYGGYVLNY